MLNEMIAEARRQDGVHDAVASIALEAIDNADLMLERLENHHELVNIILRHCLED